MPLVLHTLSDIHFDFHKSQEPFWTELDSVRAKFKEPDALVLAGDVCELSNEKLYYDVMQRFCDRYPLVILTPGNHEYYDFSFQQGEVRLGELASQFTNLTILTDGEETTVAGKRIIGGTMWYPDCGDPFLKHGFSDFRWIKDIEPKAYEANARFVKRLEKVQKGDIVISHHLPSPRSTPPQFAFSTSNCFFVHDVSDLIRSRRPALFIHGHTHTPVNYTIGNTRVYCNPVGYPREGQNPKWASRMIVTV